MTLRIAPLPKGDTFMSSFLDALQKMQKMQLQQQQIKEAKTRNAYSPQMQAEQVQQLGLRNQYQSLMNKYYPQMQEAKIKQMGKSGTYAGMPPLDRAMSIWQQYSQQYGPNSPITQEAFKNYQLMQNQMDALSNWHKMQTGIDPFKVMTTSGKEASQQNIISQGRQLPSLPMNNVSTTGVDTSAFPGIDMSGNYQINQNQYPALQNLLNKLSGSGYAR